MIYETTYEAEETKSEICQENSEGKALLMKLNYIAAKDVSTGLHQDADKTQKLAIIML